MTATIPHADEPLLRIDGLHVAFGTGDRTRSAVHGIDLSVRPGEVVGIVGESGSGKSLTALAIMQLLPRGARIGSGAVFFDGVDLLKLLRAAVNERRGRDVSMIFQDPLTALNPAIPVGTQIFDSLRTHQPQLGRSGAMARVEELLRLVGIPHPKERMRAYASELSGGMRQRIMIALAVASGPKLLIADEPTTALDVTVQAQIIAMLNRIRRELGLSILLISDNLDLVAEICDRVYVMYAGRVVEQADVVTLFEAPRHPYTRQLLRCIPRLSDGTGPMPTIPGLPPQIGQLPPGCSFAPMQPSNRPMRHGPAASLARRRTYGGLLEDWEMTPNGPGIPILELRNVRKEYTLRRGLLERLTYPARVIAAVDGVSIEIPEGSIFGLVGESGSGKSTLAQIIVRLTEPTAGQLLYQGTEIAALPAVERTRLRHRIQMVFQDTYSSLNPRKRIRRALAEALAARGIGHRQITDEIAMLMRQVGLDPALRRRFPHELSGGQRQRVGIARALAMSPEILVADEPVSSLDVSLQGQIINLLQELNRELGLTIVLISHDLAIVARICSRIAVMSAGKIVESGPPGKVLVTPSHPYTQTLIDAIPRGIEGRGRIEEPSAAAREPAYEAAAE